MKEFLTFIENYKNYFKRYDKIEDVLITNQQFKCDNQNEPDCSLPMATEQPTTQPPKVDQTPLCVCK